MADEQAKLNEMLKRVENLEARLDESVQQAEKRSTIMKALAAVLVLGLGVYFFIAYTQIGAFTPEQAFRVVQQQAENEMPQYADRLADDMIARAPEIMDNAEQYALKAPAEASEFARTYIMQRAEAHIDEMEDELYTGLKSQIDAAAAQVEESQQGPITEEKAKQLLDRAMADYRGQTDKIMADAYNWYTGRAADIVDYLHRLADADDLNQREQYHRNLVVIFLAMMERKMEAGVDADSLEGVDSITDVVNIKG